MRRSLCCRKQPSSPTPDRATTQGRCRGTACRARLRTGAWRATVAPILVLFVLPARAPAQELRADAAVEKLQVYVGEPFVFQIQVKGSESPEKPSLTGLG